MQSVLVTWSDRGASGPAPSHHGVRPKTDPGPVLRMLTRWDACPRYAEALVLTTPAGEVNARALCGELGRQIGEVDCRVLPVTDPSDHGQLYQALAPVIEALDRTHPKTRWRRDVLLSAGTPQAQTLWVILVKAGLLHARMLQVIPEAFVPDPHPSPVREVELDIDGFPEIRALRQEVEMLRARVGWGGAEIIGDSPAMQSLQLRASRLAPSELPVLILGETGSGKELVAQAIHSASLRAKGPFVAENCASIAENLLASELFGHEPGAFTGASSRRRGLFEMAHKGTLFLDEIGDMPLPVQAHLLRVLQEGRLRRVGGEAAVSVDVRIIAATHRDLRQLMAEGRFRSDLYYRLHGASIELPALRDRRDDIPALVDAFLRAPPAGRRLEVPAKVMQALQRYSWPGNVRELRAEVQRWKVFCQRRVALADVSPEISAASAQGAAPEGPPAAGGMSRLDEAVRAAESSAIARALRAHAGNLSRTARALGVDRNTLKRKLKVLDLAR